MRGLGWRVRFTRRSEDPNGRTSAVDASPALVPPIEQEVADEGDVEAQVVEVLGIGQRHLDAAVAATKTRTDADRVTALSPWRHMRPYVARSAKSTGYVRIPGSTSCADLPGLSGDFSV